MEYHEPDKWWKRQHLHNFESYSSEFVIRGRFHKSVPKEVSEEYILAEYMMAHAYYHPGLYAEAYSKVLRLTETAVRIRCDKLGIDVFRKAAKPAGDPRPKALGQLINELVAKEPTKGLGELLHQLRDERNDYMHGALTAKETALRRARIRRCVVMLNVLFMDEQYFVKAHEHMVRVMDKLEPFKSGAFAVNMLGKEVLAEGMLPISAHYTSNGWVYCLLVATVPADIHNFPAREYPEWIPFPITDLVIAGKVTAQLADSSDSITICRTNHPAALAHLSKYDTKRNEASELYIKEAEFNFTMHLDISLVKFGYEWLCMATDI